MGGTVERKSVPIGSCASWSEPSRGRRVTVSLALLVVCFLLLGAARADAAEVKRGEAVRLPDGETVDQDLYVFGGTVILEGAAARDVVVVARYLDAVGPIGGSLMVLAGRAEVRGTVGGSVRAAGASVAIYGRVEGDVVAAGGSVTIVETASVGGDVVVAGGKVTIVDGAVVGGAVRGEAVGMTIEGEIGSAVDVTTRRLHVAPSAQIGGVLRYQSRRAATIEPGAVVVGPTVRRDPAAALPMGPLLFWANGAVPRLLAMFVSGIVLVLLVPRRMAAVADSGRSAPMTSLLLGTGLVVFLPVLLILLLLTVIGSPLALVGGFGYLAGLYLSQVFVGLALGRFLLRLPAAEARRAAQSARAGRRHRLARGDAPRPGAPRVRNHRRDYSGPRVRRARSESR